MKVLLEYYNGERGTHGWEDERDNSVTVIVKPPKIETHFLYLQLSEHTIPETQSFLPRDPVFTYNDPG